jgi:hypothetical protein
MLTHHTLSSLAVLGLSTVLLGCATSGNGGAMDSTSSTTAAASASQTQGWRTLIDPTLSAWRGYREANVPAGWHVADGVLSKTGSVNDLVTRDQYANFELEFEWMVQPAGNAGVFYRGSEDAEKIYFTAPEYQLLDDAGHADGKSRLTSAGSDYALYPSPAGIVKPAKEWNSSRIVARGPHVEHWLNGQKVVEYEAGSPDWETRLKASKFATWPKYGRLTTGYIGIQGDHEGPLAIRNMRIRTLP